jgi:peroxiredoxin
LKSLLIALWLGSLASATPRLPAVSVGQPAMVFALSAVNEDVATSTVNKVQVSLSDFAGVMPAHPRSAVVVHFYDTALGQADLKSLNKVHKRFGDRGVQVLAIAEGANQAQAVSESIARLKLGFPVLRDVEHLVMARYGVSELPLTLVIEGNGNVFAIGQPRGEGIEAELQAELAPLISR